ncbi:MAG: murein biosynthesis integral membrane protein MurJ [Desulfobacteraceae bacterium]|nr:MAG: murein biosynthesis integral membrane protein MurJ [Desulfobacteraceae bacterium]
MKTQQPARPAATDENKRFTKAAGVVGLYTLLSRILGFIRDMVIAWFFGAGMLSDAFFVAFRLPNLFRRLFGEGSLTIAFIPVFSAHMAAHGKEEAFDLARSALRMLSMILVLIVIIGIIAAPGIVRIIAPGFHGVQFSLTVTLTQVMFPYVFLICLVALCMGILNAMGHFAAPALAPVLLNLSIIISVLFLSPHLPEPVLGLAIGVLIGGVLQLGLQVPFMMQKGFYFWHPAKIYHPALKRIGSMMIPSVFGAAVYQISILIGTLLASFLPEGSVSYLYYADRVVQFPLGVFAVSMSVAVLPSLSRQAADGNMADLKDTFAYAVKMIFFITAPASIGLMALRQPIVNLLFQRGAFDAASAAMTADALLCFSIGLCAFSAVRIVVSIFYALGDAQTPVKIAIISILANIIAGITLMGPLGHSGLALATSLSSFLNVGLLTLALRKKLGGFGGKKIVESVLKSVICSFVMGSCLWTLAELMPATGAPSSFQSLLIVATGIGSGIFIYCLSAYFLKSRELKEILTFARKG